METPVGVAMGDCACVVQGTLDSPERDVCVMFGTSSQIALVIPRNEGLNSSFDSQLNFVRTSKRISCSLELR